MICKTPFIKVYFASMHGPQHRKGERSGEGGNGGACNGW
jgi:hypothetical protein